MPHPSRAQILAYAAIGVAVLVLGGRWLAGSGAGSAPAADAPAIESGRPSGDPGAPAGGQEADAEEPATGEAGPVVESSTRASVVHVAGAVRQPGVYRLAAGARVREAVQRAGGATRRADVNAINLAALVQDGVQVVVPRRAPPAAVAAGGAGASASTVASAAGGGAVPSAPVNLNTATAEDLQTLDGVGPATAADILEYRSQHGGFRSVEDLDQVTGIGPKTMEALRDKVTV